MGKILIVGGQMENKGAQAMTYTVVSEMKAIHPDKEIILASITNNLINEELEKKFAFGFLNINKKVKIELLGGLYKLLSKFIRVSKINCDKDQVIQVLKDTDMIIDISGYALSSKFSIANTINYLTNITLAKKYNIPIYLFPQSFGPFNYKGFYKYIINKLMKKNLKYPKIIFAREQEGYDSLKEYTTNNLKVSLDIVLQAPNEYNIESIFNDGYYKKEIPLKIKDNSVAIVPNVKTVKHGNMESLISYYEHCIDYLLEREMNIYLLRHSTEDLELCKAIKKTYMSNEKVILLESEYDCIEVHGILRQFNFIIASRYHSIIHAYKNGIPVIALGWAIKYRELLKQFNQQKYLFDVRNSYAREEVLDVLSVMVNKRVEESVKISNKLKKIQHSTIFDRIFKD